MLMNRVQVQINLIHYDNAAYVLSLGKRCAG